MEKLTRATTDEDCWAIFFSACGAANRASSKTVGRWRRAVKARIAELRRERLARPRIILPNEGPRRIHVPGGVRS